jgi:hypothetical protein
LFGFVGGGGGIGGIGGGCICGGVRDGAGIGGSGGGGITGGELFRGSNTSASAGTGVGVGWQFYHNKKVPGKDQAALAGTLRFLLFSFSML